MNLHERALELAAQYKLTQSELIDILQKIDDKKIYREHGTASLYEYAAKVLRLCESTCYSLILIARKSKQIPELKKAIQAGELTVSNARRIAPLLTLENKEEWIEKAKTLSQKKLEKEVVKVNPKAVTPDRTQYIAESTIKLEAAISEETLELLKRVQDLVSQKTGKAATLEDTLKEALSLYVEKKDVLKQLGARQARKLALKRDNAQCTLTQNGKRCEQRRWIEAHHVIPKEFGGKDTLENFTTLCHSHHRALHSKPLL